MAGYHFLGDLLRILILLCVAVYGQAPLSTVNQASTFTDCGGTLKDPFGVITSPNFPNPYPIPIYCRWVIEAPPDKAIAVYFTQHYMRDGLRFSEYAFFTDTLYMDKYDFGVISSDKEPTYLTSDKRVLVVEFQVRELGNIHLRIRQFLLDVFGFNITYEIIDKNSKERTERCIDDHCSFTGNCYANANFSSYYCSCFPGFFGEDCQFNEFCGPTATETLCMNNGTCRFYIGSTARTCECPPDFEGARCETRKEVPKEECINYGCSHSCTKIDGNITCKCESGYRLAARDMKTCVEEGRTKYRVEFKMYDQNVDLAHLDSVRYNQLKRGVENALVSVLKPRIFQVDNLTVVAFKPSAIVQFQFFGQRDDNAQIKIVLEEILKKGKIDNKYTVNRTYLVFDWEPALSIKGLEASDNMPVVRGTEFTLACIVQATTAMSLKWLKDGAPINVQTPYRTLWTSQVPKNSRDQYTVLLGFDKVNILDSGIFTCQVSDSGSTHSKSKVVNVISVSPPTIEPLTATVTYGESFVVTCTPDTYRKFGYTWLKNGKILKPYSEPERVEDLFPTGSRILVDSAESSVTYTCHISSPAGASSRESVITVIDKDAPVCSSEKKGGIEWSLTAANTVNQQGCPPGYSGIVSRRCGFKKETGVFWEEPDFSSCLSSEFYTIKSSFDSLKMGYLLTDLETVTHKLKSYLWSREAVLHHAEGEPVVELLEELLDYHERTKRLFDDPPWNVSETFTDIVSFLLERPHLIQKQSHFIKLYEAIRDYGLIQGSLTEVGTYRTFVKETFVVEVGNIPYGSSYQLKFPQRNRSRKEIKAKHHPSWLVDSVELEINFNQDHISGNSSVSVAAVFFKNFSTFLPEHYIAQLGGLDIEYQLHSQPLAVAVKVIGEAMTEGPIVSVRVRMSHLGTWSKSLWNITCGKADFADRKFNFLLERCKVVRTSTNFTTCQCYDPGMYAVLLTSFTNPSLLSGRDGFEIIAGVGCGICAFLLCLTFFILLILWKKLKGAITALKLQVCVALIGAYITVLKGLHNSIQMEYYSYVISVIQFFLLAAFSMQLCLGLIVYIEFASLQSIQYPELKVAAMGWAVPTIVVGATLAAQVPEGFLMDSWWLKFGTNFFFAYIVSVFIILMLQIILFLTVKAEIRHHHKIESLKEKTIANRSKLLHCSLVISFFLLITSVCSILYINYDDVIFKYLFSLSSAILGMIIFLCYTFCSETSSLLCCPKKHEKEEKEEPKLHAESNSFKSFLKPEIVGESACFLNKYSDTTDKSKQLDSVQKLRPPVERCAEQDWLEGGCLLREKDLQLRVATVHSPNKKKPVKKSQYKDLNKAENLHQMSPRKLKWHQLDSSMAPTFELEPMYDSPRSNPLGKALESISLENNIPSTTRPPPYHDPCSNVRKEYSIKTNPLSTFDPQSPRSLKSDFSALVVPKTTESRNSASVPNHLGSVKATNHNGRLSGKDKKDSHLSHERIPLMSPSKHDSGSLTSTPDDSTNPSNSIADLISRDDDFATEVEVPSASADGGTSRSGSEQVSPSRISWSTTAV